MHLASTWWMRWEKWTFSVTFTRRLSTPLRWWPLHQQTSTTFLRAIQVAKSFLFAYIVSFAYSANITSGQLALGLTHFHQKGYFLTLTESLVDEQTRRGGSSAIAKAAAAAVRVVGDLCLWYAVISANESFAHKFASCYLLLGASVEMRTVRAFSAI